MNIIKKSQGRNVLVNLFAGKTGAEVGTERGKYAEKIAAVAEQLYVVDLWSNYPGYREHVSDEEYNEILEDAHRRLDKFGVRFIRDTSISASLIIEDESLDFVYLDANHEPHFVLEDLMVWYRKVKPGGIVAGHDYTGRHGKGVSKAVNMFCEGNKIEELVVWAGDKSASYHFVKP